MKNILALFILAFPLSGFSQNTNPNSFEFTDVVHVDSVPKDELFMRARQWFSNSFNDSKSVLEISDKESGELQGKGNIKMILGNRADGIMRFSVSIHLKDGKYRYSFFNFIHEGNLQGLSTPKPWHADLGLLTNDEKCPACNENGGGLGLWPGVCQESWVSAKKITKSTMNSIINSLKSDMAKKTNEW